MSSSPDPRMGTRHLMPLLPTFLKRINNPMRKGESNGFVFEGSRETALGRWGVATFGADKEEDQ